MRRYTLADITPILGPGITVVGSRELGFTSVGSAAEAEEDALVWIRPSRADKQDLLDATRALTVVCDPSLDTTGAVAAGKSLILAENPKIVFSRIVEALFRGDRESGIHPTAVIHRAASLGERVSIGPFCVVGDAVIGDDATLHAHVTIYDGVEIGRNVTIHAGTVIGADGFGYERDDEGSVQKFPHIGGVVIEDDVEIHSVVAIDRGSLGNTVVRRGVKVDNHVHIAHNCDIGEGTFVIAHAMLAGSVTVGRNVWLGPATVFRDNISIGDGAFIGIGALVVKDVPAGEVHMGNPARRADDYKQLLNALNRLLLED